MRFKKRKIISFILCEFLSLWMYNYVFTSLCMCMFTFTVLCWETRAGSFSFYCLWCNKPHSLNLNAANFNWTHFLHLKLYENKKWITKQKLTVELTLNNKKYFFSLLLIPYLNISCFCMKMVSHSNQALLILFKPFLQLTLICLM